MDIIHIICDDIPSHQGNEKNIAWVHSKLEAQLSKTDKTKPPTSILISTEAPRQQVIVSVVLEMDQGD